MVHFTIYIYIYCQAILKLILMYFVYLLAVYFVVRNIPENPISDTMQLFIDYIASY